MKRLIVLALCLFCMGSWAHAEGEVTMVPVAYKNGPLEIMMPFRSGAAVYMYDFNSHRNLVGGETPILRLWDKLEGNGGIVTSLKGRGTAFLSSSLYIGNVLERWVTLPEDLKVGGYGGWDFRDEAWMYGLKAAYKLW